MSTRYIIPLLVAGAVALACGSRSHSESAAAVPGVKSLSQALASTAIAAPVPTPKVVHLTEGAAPALTSVFRVQGSKGALHFALDVTNPGKKRLELRFPSGQEYEFSMLDGAGVEVYRWSTARMFTQSRQNRVLDGGDTMHIKEDARTTLPAGTYTAVATLRSSNFPMTDRIAVTVQ